MHPLIWNGSLRESLQNSTDTSYVVESSFFYISSYLHYNTLKLESAEAQKRGEKKSWKIKTVKSSSELNNSLGKDLLFCINYKYRSSLF